MIDTQVAYDHTRFVLSRMPYALLVTDKCELNGDLMPLRDSVLCVTDGPMRLGSVDAVFGTWSTTGQCLRYAVDVKYNSTLRASNLLVSKMGPQVQTNKRHSPPTPVRALPKRTNCSPEVHCRNERNKYTKHTKQIEVREWMLKKKRVLERARATNHPDLGEIVAVDFVIFFTAQRPACACRVLRVTYDALAAWQTQAESLPAGLRWVYHGTTPSVPLFGAPAAAPGHPGPAGPAAPAAGPAPHVLNKRQVLEVTLERPQELQDFAGPGQPPLCMPLTNDNVNLLGNSQSQKTGRKRVVELCGPPRSGRDAKRRKQSWYEWTDVLAKYPAIAALPGANAAIANLGAGGHG